MPTRPVMLVVSLGQAQTARQLTAGWFRRVRPPRRSARRGCPFWHEAISRCALLVGPLVDKRTPMTSVLDKRAGEGVPGQTCTCGAHRLRADHCMNWPSRAEAVMLAQERRHPGSSKAWCRTGAPRKCLQQTVGSARGSERRLAPIGSAGRRPSRSSPARPLEFAVGSSCRETRSDACAAGGDDARDPKPMSSARS